MNPKDAIGRSKPGITNVPPAALLHIGQVMDHGSDKYERFNWRTDKVFLSVYLNAAFRHLAQIIDGEWLDEDSGKPHAAHIAAGMSVILDAMEMDQLIDDLDDIAGPTSTVIDDMTKEV